MSPEFALEHQSSKLRADADQGHYSRAVWRGDDRSLGAPETSLKSFVIAGRNLDVLPSAFGPRFSFKKIIDIKKIASIFKHMILK